MDESEWFGELRSAAYGEESMSGWRRICAVLDQMSESFGRERAIPYLNEALAGWSAQTRRAPARWVHEAAFGGATWRLAAAREVCFDQQVVAQTIVPDEEGHLGGESDDTATRRWGSARAARVLASEDTRAVTSLVVWGFPYVSAQGFEACPLLDGLTSFWLDGWRYRGRWGDAVDALDVLMSVVSPTIERLRLDDVTFDQGVVESLANMPRLTRLDSPITLHVLDAEEGVGALAGLEHLHVDWDGSTDVEPGALPGLRSLEITLGDLRDPTRPRVVARWLGSRPLTPWLSWEGWERLESLTVRASQGRTWKNTRGDEHARACVESLADALARATNLKSLVLTVPMSAKDLEEIMALESLSGLEQVRLPEENLKGKAGEQLARGFVGGKPITHLDLADCGLTPNVAGKTGWPEITRWIDVSGKNKLGEDGAKRIAELGEVEVAWLERVGLGPAGGKALAGGAFGDKVRALDLKANRLGAEGLEGLFSREWPRLESLWLGAYSVPNAFDEDAMRVLAGWEGLANLKFLSLTSERMSGEAMEALLTSPYLKNLEILDISGNTITPEAAEALAAMPCVPKLRVLAVGYSGAVKNAWAELIEGDWRALEMLYFADERLRVGEQRFIMANMGRFPVLEYLDVDASFKNTVHKTANREDFMEYGLLEDGTFPYTFTGISYRGVAEAHAESWRPNDWVRSRSLWKDTVAR